MTSTEKPKLQAVCNHLIHFLGKMGMVSYLREDPTRYADEQTPEWWDEFRTDATNRLHTAHTDTLCLAEELRDRFEKPGHMEQRVQDVFTFIRRAAPVLFRPGKWDKEQAQICNEIFADIEVVAARLWPAAQAAGISMRRITHGEDYTWIVVAGTVHHFSPGNQAEVVRTLYGEWERSGRIDGCGMNEKAIGDAIGSESKNFRIQTTFKEHPALGSLIRQVTKSVYALYLNEAASDEPA